MTTSAIARPRSRPPAAPVWYTHGDDMIEWTERHLVYPRGSMIGQPLRWLPWQKRYFRELFRCDSDGVLQYRWSLLGVPKKNGKSVMLAALGLYHLLGDPDEPDPWAVIAATSDRQADIVFNDAKEMAFRSPTLNPVTLRYRWEIRPKGGPGRLERVAASKGKLDGKDISFLGIDELHEWDRENWGILTNGTVGRHRAQIAQITTAGFDLETICGEEYEKGRQIESGEVPNPSYFFQWWGAPEGADYKSPRTWKACNPSYGVTVTRETLQDQLAKSKHPALFRRYFLNQWTSAESEWLTANAWTKTTGDAFLLPGLPTWAGWDASTKRDTTALVAVQWQGTGPKRRLVVVFKLWERPILDDGRPDEDWLLPIGQVEQSIRDLAAFCDLQSVAYDPAFITWSAADLEAAGLPMEEWPQTNGRMVPATQATYELIETGAMLHDADPRFARQVANVVAYQTREGGQRLGKGKQRKPIDIPIAMVMAIGSMTRAEDEPEPQIYG